MSDTYSVQGYGEMIADTVRMESYARALREAIRPGTVVADVGTGAGVFAVLASRYGARRIFAIEPEDVIHVAREVAAANDCAERIEFIQEMSTRVTLPEPADILISDLRGVVPLFQQHLPSIVDARNRLLKPGGTLIARQDRMYAAIVEAPELHLPCVVPWVDNTFGLDLGAGKSIVTNNWRKCRVKPEQLLASPALWATLDYRTFESPDVSAEVSFSGVRAGKAHGVVLWFDSQLTEGIEISNAPGKPEMIYGNAFFPFLEAVDLDDGDCVTVKLQAALTGEDYLWCWDTSVLARGDARRIKASFKQSTFFGVPLSPATLKKRSDGYVPTLGEDGEIDRCVLELMAGTTPLGEIARKVAARFPLRYPTARKAMDRVGELSLKYSR